MHGREGARKIFEPLGEVLAAGDARKQGRIAMSGEVLVSAQVDFRARAGKGGGIRTDAVLQGGGKPDAGPDVVSPQVLREQCAHRAVLGPDVHIGGVHGMLGNSRMMIDNNGKRDTRKGGVVMRLRIDHREM